MSAETSSSSTGMSGEEIIAKKAKYVFPSVFTYYSSPMPVVRAEGKHIYDADGREYLDFFGGTLILSVTWG